MESGYNSTGFDEAMNKLAQSGIRPYADRVFDASGRTVWSGTDPRFRLTAEALFGMSAGNTVCTELLNEIPSGAFCRTERKLPLPVWRAMAFLQWLVNDPRQPESRKESLNKAGQLADMLQQKQENCILVSDERRINLLAGELRRRGFHIRRGGICRIGYLERIVATDNELYCGGCGHNCPLTNPGCPVGKDAAARAGIKTRTS
jgi:hypothetical protein